MIKRKNKLLLLFIHFILFSLYSSLILENSYNINNINTQIPKISSLSSNYNTITDGNELKRYENYLFKSEIYDSLNSSRLFSNGTLETKLVGDDISQKTELNVSSLVSKTPHGSDVIMNYGTKKNEDNMHFKDGNFNNFTSTRNGHYNSTFTFDNQTNGILDTKFFNRGNNGYYVQDSFSGHSKIIRLYAPSGSGGGGSRNVPNIRYGTIEYWGATSTPDGTYFEEIRFIDQTNLWVAFNTWWGGNYIKAINYNTPTGTNVNLISLSANTWYHIRIDFDLRSDGGYLGLAGRTYNISINSARPTTLRTGWYSDSLSIIGTYSNTYQHPVYFYMDAWGLTWEGNYRRGANKVAIDRYLDFNIEIDFQVESRELMYIKALSYHKTDIRQQLTFSILDFNRNKYVQINSSINNRAFFGSYYYNSTAPSNFVNSLGYVRLRFRGINTTIDHFHLFIDKVEVSLAFKKAIISAYKSFNLIGNYKYRYKVSSFYGIFYTDWIYFYVIDADYPTTNNLIIEDSTITDGQDLSENYEYDFDSTAYDSNNYTKEFYGGELITKNIEGNIVNENPILNFDNNRNIQVDYNNISMYKSFQYNDNNMKTVNSIGNLFEPNGKGTYNGTYSFTNERVGTVDTSIPFVSSVSELGYTAIALSFLNHTKVLEVGKSLLLGANNYNMQHSHGNSRLVGTIEYWVCFMDNTNDASNYYEIALQEGTTSKVILRFYSSKLYYYSGITLTDSGIPIISDRWYHIRETWFSNNTFDIYVNENRLLTNKAMYSSMSTGISNTKFLDMNSRSFSLMYLDAISYSFDSGYRIGSNFHYLNNVNIVNATITLQTDMNKEFISFQLDSIHKIYAGYTDNLIFMNISIYDWSIFDWVVIGYFFNISSYTTFSFKDLTDASKYVSPSGLIYVRYYSKSEKDYTYQLNIDYFNIRLFYKALLHVKLSFNIKGLWKYRWHLLGSDYYSNWTYYEVITPSPNIRLISESNHLTTWEVLNRYATTNDLFTETFDSNLTTRKWNLYEGATDLSRRTFLAGGTKKGMYLFNNSVFKGIKYVKTFTFSTAPSGDKDLDFTSSGIWRGDIKGGYFSITKNHLFSGSELYTFRIDNLQSNYKVDGVTTNDQFIWFSSNHDFSYREFKLSMLGTFIGGGYSQAFTPTPFIKINQTNMVQMDVSGNKRICVMKTDASYTIYSLSTMTTPKGFCYDDDLHCWWIADSTDKKLYQFSSSFVKTGISVSLDPSNTPSGITYGNNTFYVYDYSTTKVFVYEKIYNCSYLYQDKGYMYIQSNMTKTLNLKSRNVLSITMKSTDKIEIRFKTTNTNAINFKVYNNGTTAKYTISPQGNTNFGWQTITLIAGWNDTLHQIEFNGVFNDKTYLIIDYIKIYQYTIGTVIQYHYLEPFGSSSILLEFYKAFSVNVYEYSILKRSFNLTSTEDLQYLLYDKIETVDCYISFYTSQNDYLSFYSFTIYANYTYQGIILTNIRMTSNILTVDVNTLISFNVFDTFNKLVKDFDTSATTFIDIILNIYELKIQNNAIEFITYTLKAISSAVVKSGNILSGEVITLHISSANYRLNYTNHENNVYYSYLINLNQNKIFIVNTTFYNVYFAIFSYDGLGLDYSTARFYINGSRREFGFNLVRSEFANLLILDYFNTTLFNQTVNIRGLAEYNMFIEIYTLNILNIFNFNDIIVNITRGNIWISQLIPVEQGLSYRFLPNVNYTIIAQYINQTLISSRTINLTTNGQIESFGVKKPAVPFFPRDAWISLYNQMGYDITNQLKIYKNGERIMGGITSIASNFTEIIVKDFFDVELYNDIVNYNTEINILINSISVLIQNNYSKAFVLRIRQSSNYIWRIEDVIGSLDAKIYQLSSGYYVFNATDFNGNVIEVKTVAITNSNKITSLGFYPKIELPFFPAYSYISIYNNRGFGITSMVKIYKDGSRIDGGLTSIYNNKTNIIVKDFFDRILYNQNHTYSTEINVLIQTTTLAIVNQYNNMSVNLMIRREISTNWEIQIIMSPLSTIYYEFIKDTYLFKIEKMDGITLDIIKKNVSGDYINVTFGFYSTKVPTIPMPEIVNAMQQWGIIVLAVIIFVAIIGFIWYRYQKEKLSQRNKTPIEYIPSIMKENPFT